MRVTWQVIAGTNPFFENSSQPRVQLLCTLAMPDQALSSDEGVKCRYGHNPGRQHIPNPIRSPKVAYA